MKVIFIVQGEGRGHMTQALAMEQMLTEAGHEVSSIIIGTCNRREIPSYFKRQTKTELHTVSSPNFYFDKNSKSINLWKTLFYNLLAMPGFLRELRKIHQIVKKEKPEVIVNFYDLLAGVYFGLYAPKVKRISIAHQYLAAHPDFPFAKGTPLQKHLFKLTNWATSMNSHSRIALSFSPYGHKNSGLTVAPPLLRAALFSTEITKGDYLLVYVVNKGYAQELMEWHVKNKKVKIHCFWDNKDLEDEWSPWAGITFHYINDGKFLEMMAGCMGYVSTAGFESICEAMYLGKPVMMVPVARQYEQACNALDAVKAGAGIKARSFALGKFLNHLSTTRPNTLEFREWTKLYKTIILSEIENYTPDKGPEKLKLKPDGAIDLLFRT